MQNIVERRHVLRAAGAVGAAAAAGIAVTDSARADELYLSVMVVGEITAAR